MSVIFLMGQTATGKTAASIALAKHMPIEIISVDSTNVYRGMDIGTAKPSPEQRASIPHHLIDIRDPWEGYSAGQFCLDARKLIKEIQQRNKTPVLVGGTMLYFQTLCRGYDGGPSTCPIIRENIQKEAEALGWQVMWERLSEQNPVAAKRIHQNDKQRIGRALERDALKQSANPETIIPPLTGEQEIIQIALMTHDRDRLRIRIAERLDTMLASGFLEEVTELLTHPQINTDLPALKTVGYAQACQHLEGTIDRDTMIESIRIATSQLAKRQHTWLNQFPEALQLECFDAELTQKMIAQLH